MSVASEAPQGPEGKPAILTEAPEMQERRRHGFFGWGRNHHRNMSESGNTAGDVGLQDGVPHPTGDEGPHRHPWGGRRGCRPNMEQYGPGPHGPGPYGPGPHGPGPYGPGPHGPDFVPSMGGPYYGWGHPMWRRWGGMLKTEERALFKEFDFW